MKILFVDDEAFYMQPYVNAFKATPDVMDVAEINTADEAINKIRANTGSGEYDCLVLDVMMPPPSGWEARTEDGKYTGAEVLKECLDDIAAVELPVLLLSNLGFDLVNRRVSVLALAKNMVRVCSKNLTPPPDAKLIVRELVAVRISRLNAPIKLSTAK